MNQWQRFVLASREGRYEPHRHDLTGEEEASQKDANYGAQPAHAGGVGHYQLKEQKIGTNHDERGDRGNGAVLEPGERQRTAGGEALRGRGVGVRLPCLLLRVNSE